MNEVDKRIAEEVFGEPEPPPLPEWGLVGADNAWTTSRNWHWNEYVMGPTRWCPAPFSGNLDQALRAVDRYFEANQGSSHNKRIGMWYWPARGELAQCSASFNSTFSYAQTLPEAICNLLLALVEDSW